MLSRFASLIPRGSFIRSVSILTGGTVFAQGIVIITMPILTRLYTPDDFTLLAVFSSILAIISVIASLRYNIAIFIPNSDVDGFDLLVLSIFFAAITSLVTAAFVFLIPEKVSEWIKQPELVQYLWLLPIGIFFAASYDALQYWASRMKRFSIISYTRITRATGAVATQIGLGLASPSPFGLIFGNVLYGGLGIVGLAVNLMRKDQAVVQGLSAKRALKQARAHNRFPAYSVPEAILNTSALELPIILIAAVAAGPEAGLLLLAMRVVGLPMALIGSSVAQVYLAEARERRAEGELAHFTRNTMLALLKTGGPAILAVGFASPFLFPVIFGEEWARSGWLVAWMVPWFVLQFVTSPVSMVFHILGMQIWAAVLQAVGLVIRIGAVLIASQQAPEWIGEIFAASGAVFYGLYAWAIALLIRKVR